MSHEHNAGIQLLAKCLKEGASKLVTPVVQLNGWPSDESIFEGADAVVIYADGGGRHPALQGNNLEKLGKLMKTGAGFLTIHYAVEPTTNKGNKEFLDWQGGCFETHWSVNPHWVANFNKLPKHPITRGVKPFKIKDEWYFHMRFRSDNMGKLIPILSDLAPKETMKRGDGAHSGNPAVRKAVAAGKSQHVAWAYQREDGGRGFGFTGGHNHLNWGNDDFRKTVLNAILWVAKAKVPKEGVPSKVTKEDLYANLDGRRGKKPAPKSAPGAKKKIISLGYQAYRENFNRSGREAAPRLAKRRWRLARRPVPNGPPTRGAARANHAPGFHRQKPGQRCQPLDKFSIQYRAVSDDLAKGNRAAFDVTVPLDIPVQIGAVRLASPRGLGRFGC